MVTEIDTILMIADDIDFTRYETGAIGKIISLAFHAYVERPK
jgi:HD superfamily phosphohydrolase YqeK